MNLLRSAALLALASLALAASAQTPAVAVTSGVMTSTVDGIGIGWGFTLAQPMLVSALGYFDLTPDTPLGATHPVALYAAGGTLLASATVLTNDPLTAGARYHALAAPLLLPAGTYEIDSVYGGGDSYYTQAQFTAASGVGYLGGVFNPNGIGYVGSYGSSSNGGRFGPNLLLQAVPEPSAFAALGLGAVAMLRRRKRA